MSSASLSSRGSGDLKLTPELDSITDQQQFAATCTSRQTCHHQNNSNLHFIFPLMFCSFASFYWIYFLYFT